MAVLANSRSAQVRNLQWLCLLRAILIVSLGIAIAIAQAVFDVPLLADPWISLALGGLTLANVLTFWRMRHARTVSEPELFLQLVLDVLIMTLVLYRTGGSTNPFVSWYLVPLTIASATLRLRYSLGLAVLTLAAYSLLLFFYQPFYPLSGHVVLSDGSHEAHLLAASSMHEGFSSHVVGMWLNFLLSAVLITWFVSRMSQALREQDRQLADQHERLLQKEQVVAMGAMAAGAAHELGTPLSTMTVLVQDMDDSLPAEHALKADLHILREQLQQCRGILGGLREQAMHPERSPVLSLQEYADSLLQKMALLHPGRVLQSRVGEGSDIRITPGLMVQQVVVNLLNNAAEAGIRQVDWHMQVVNGLFTLEIHDDGPGLPPGISERLGQPYVSSKSDGLGLGFFLSHATVNQWGGTLQLQPSMRGGTLTLLQLPLRAMGEAPHHG